MLLTCVAPAFSHLSVREIVTRLSTSLDTPLLVCGSSATRVCTTKSSCAMKTDGTPLRGATPSTQSPTRFACIASHSVFASACIGATVPRGEEGGQAQNACRTLKICVYSTEWSTEHVVACLSPVSLQFISLLSCSTCILYVSLKSICRCAKSWILDGALKRADISVCLPAVDRSQGAPEGLHSGGARQHSPQRATWHRQGKNLFCAVDDQQVRVRW